MSEKTTRKQIRILYLIDVVGYFQIASASWVALLALRGFSLLEIGVLESMFHIVSVCFELPSGVIADVFGRRRTLIASQAVSLLSGILMIFSSGFATTALAISFCLVEVKTEKTASRHTVRDEMISVVRESWKFLVCQKKVRNIMLVNALVGAISTLVLFFLQAKLPLAGMSSALLGPALFVMGLGAAIGSRMAAFFYGYRYRTILFFSFAGVLFAFAMSFTEIPFLMVLGGLIGSFSDDFLEVRTDIHLNGMIPSGQRATLISVNSFVFSVIMIVLSTVFGWIM